MNLRERVPDLQLAIRASGAAVIAMSIAEFLKFPNPFFAFIAAVIVTDLSPHTSRKLGVRRILSTIVGAGTGALIAPVFNSSALAVGAGILIAMVICQFIGARDGARVAGFTCGIIVMNDDSNVWLYSIDRFFETILGVLVAWGVSYVPKLIDGDGEDKQ